MAGEDEIEYFFLKEDDFEEVVSFLAEDYFQREPIEEVYRIAEHVVNHVFEEEADKFLMMFLLSVHKDYGARGIAGRMIKMSMEAGHAQGAQIAFTCISNVLSGKVFEKLGFRKGFTLEYEKPGHDFKVDLTKMHGNKVAYLVMKELP